MGIKRVFLRAWVILALLTAAAAGWVGKPDSATTFPTTKEFARFLPKNIGYVVSCDATAGMYQGTVSFPDGDALQFCSSTGVQDEALTRDVNEAVQTALRRMHLKSFLLIWFGAMVTVIAVTFAADWVARGAGRGFLFETSPPQGVKLASWLGAIGLLGSLALGSLLDLPEWVLWFPILFLILADHVLASRGIATRWVRYPSVLLVFALARFALNLVFSLALSVVLSGGFQNEDNKFIVLMLSLASWVVPFFAARAYAKWMAHRARLRPWLLVATTSDAGTTQAQSSIDPATNKD